MATSSQKPATWLHRHVGSHGPQQGPGKIGTGTTGDPHAPAHVPPRDNTATAQPPITPGTTPAQPQQA
jgi:hypothetical protein